MEMGDAVELIVDAIRELGTRIAGAAQNQTVEAQRRHDLLEAQVVGVQDELKRIADVMEREIPVIVQVLSRISRTEALGGMTAAVAAGAIKVEEGGRTDEELMQATMHEVGAGWMELWKEVLTPLLDVRALQGIAPKATDNGKETG